MEICQIAKDFKFTPKQDVDKSENDMATQLFEERYPSGTST